MESIISFLIREIFIFPILFIMITGVLVVPFVTPVACAGWLVGSLLGKVPIFKTPVTFLLALYGVGLTVGIWFMNPGIALIEAVANSPVAALGIPGLAPINTDAPRPFCNLEFSRSLGPELDQRARSCRQGSAPLTIAFVDSEFTCWILYA